MLKFPVECDLYVVYLDENIVEVDYANKNRYSITKQLVVNLTWNCHALNKTPDPLLGEFLHHVNNMKIDKINILFYQLIDEIIQPHPTDCQTGKTHTGCPRDQCLSGKWGLNQGIPLNPLIRQCYDGLRSFRRDLNCVPMMPSDASFSSSYSLVGVVSPVWIDCGVGEPGRRVDSKNVYIYF